MKTKFRKIGYWSIAVIFTVAVVLGSCSKEESNVPEVENENEIEQKEDEKQDFSQMAGGALLLSEKEYKKLPLAEDVKIKAAPTYKYLDCPPVGDQGSDGSCVGWATAYAARSIMSGVNYYFSPAYVYNQTKISNCASGTYPSRALNLIKNQGVCEWRYMPYQDGDCYTQPNYTQRQNAANYKIRGYYRVSRTVSAIRNQIAYGRPVVVAGKVDNAFMSLGYNRILRSVSGYGGGHAYTVVGYNDNYNCFLVLNSWGTNWATNGYGWISYNIVGQLWSEAYIMY